MVRQITHRIFLSAGLLALVSFRSTLPAQEPRIVRAPVWVYLEEVPGNQTTDDTPPIENLYSVARFVLSGMIYGWKFSYTPSDRARSVAESFTLTPIMEIPSNDPNFVVESIKPAYPRLSCWAQYTLNQSDGRWVRYWTSVLFKSAQGRGYGERTAETEGIRQAYTRAMLLAIRQNARSLEKNKPKEIHGEILLREGPRLFADEGRFVAEVKVLIHISEIIPYRSF